MKKIGMQIWSLMEIEISQTASIVVETGQTNLDQPRMYTEPTCMALRKIKTSCKVFLTYMYEGLDGV